MDLLNKRRFQVCSDVRGMHILVTQHGFGCSVGLSGAIHHDQSLPDSIISLIQFLFNDATGWYHRALQRMS